MNWTTLLILKFHVLATTTGGTIAGAVQAEPNHTLVIASLALTAAAVLFFSMELFLPSGGILALLCGICAIASITVMFFYSPPLGVLTLFAYVVVVPFALYYGVKIWERSSVGRMLILDADEDFTTPNESAAQSEEDRRDRVDSIKDLIGRTGVTDSSLRPVGFVRVDGERLDAIAEGDLIEAGESVIVVDAYDNQLKVRPVTEDDPQSD